jgi:hypothetical protein
VFKLNCFGCFPLLLFWGLELVSAVAFFLFWGLELDFAAAFFFLDAAPGQPAHVLIRGLEMLDKFSPEIHEFWHQKR